MKLGFKKKKKNPILKYKSQTKKFLKTFLWWFVFAFGYKK